MTSPCAEAPGPAAQDRLSGQRRLRLVGGRAREGMVAIAGTAPDPLTEALARDLDGSFEAVVREYQDRLYSFALRLTGRPEDAEDVAQDAFVRAYRALQSYGAERVRALALKAWLYRITLNVARNRLRGKKPK